MNVRDGLRSLTRAALTALVLVPGVALGQTPVVVPTPAPAGPPRIEVAIAGMAMSGGALDTPAASGVSNQVPTGGAATYFQTDARLAAAYGAELRTSVRLAGGWLAEAGVAYTRPALEVRLSGDIEDASPLTATGRLLQVVVDGAVVRRFGRRRVLPFAMAGGGYLRQLDEPRTTVGTGQIWFGGGGVLVGWRGAPAEAQRLRLRADVRLASVHGGLPLTEAGPVRLIATIGVSLRAW